MSKKGAPSPAAVLELSSGALKNFQAIGKRLQSQACEFSGDLGDVPNYWPVPRISTLLDLCELASRFEMKVAT